jgi:hypothetical protein
VPLLSRRVPLLSRRVPLLSRFGSAVFLTTSRKALLDQSRQQWHPADTVVLIETDESAKVVGTGYAYFVWPGASAPWSNNNVLDAPLTFLDLNARRVASSTGQFQFSDAWTVNAGFGTYYTIDVYQGAFTANGNGGNWY